MVYGVQMVTPTVMSTSSDRGVAVKFAAGLGGTKPACSTRGMLLCLEIDPHCVVADVSWISKFPPECEYAIAPFQVWMCKMVTYAEDSRVARGDARTQQELRRLYAPRLSDLVNYVTE